MQESFWGCQFSDTYITSLFPNLHTSPPTAPFSPLLISLMISVDVKHHHYLLGFIPRSDRGITVWNQCYFLVRSD